MRPLSEFPGRRRMISRKNLVLCSLFGAIAVAIALLSFVALGFDLSRGGGSAEAHGTTVVGIDMDPTNGATEDISVSPFSCSDNVDNGGGDLIDGADPDCAGANTGRNTPADTGGTLGSIEPCIQVPNTLASTFLTGTFVDAIPAGEDLDSYNYPLYWSGLDDDGDSSVDEDPPGFGDADGDTVDGEDPANNPPVAQIDDPDNNPGVVTEYDNTILATGCTDFSEGEDDKLSPHSEAVGSGAANTNTGGDFGAIAHTRWTIGIDTDANTTVDTLGADGLYFMSFDKWTTVAGNDGALISFNSAGTGNDWGDAGLELVTSYHDGNHTPAFGMLALG